MSTRIKYTCVTTYPDGDYRTWASFDKRGKAVAWIRRHMTAATRMQKIRWFICKDTRIDKGKFPGAKSSVRKMSALEEIHE